MQRKQSSGFNIKFDDESPDILLRDETQHNTTNQKTGQRFLITVIIIIFILCIVIASSYLDLRRRIESTLSKSSESTQNLSQDQDSKFSSLSLKYAKIEDLFGEKTNTIDKMILKLTDELKKTNKDIELSQNKISDLKKYLPSLEKSLNDLKHNYETVNKHIDQIENKISDFNKNLLETNSSLQMVRNEIAGIKADRVGKKDIEKMFEDKQQQYEEKLDKIATKMEIIILSIKNRLKELEKSKQGEAQLLPHPQLTPPSKTPSNMPKPGEFIEQNLQ